MEKLSVDPAVHGNMPKKLKGVIHGYIFFGLLGISASGFLIVLDSFDLGLRIAMFLYGIPFIFSFMLLITAKGLKCKKQWAKNTAIVLSILAIPGFPVGTVVGIFWLIRLFSKDAAQWFVVTKINEPWMNGKQSKYVWLLTGFIIANSVALAIVPITVVPQAWVPGTTPRFYSYAIFDNLPPLWTILWPALLFLKRVYYVMGLSAIILCTVFFRFRWWWVFYFLLTAASAFSTFINVQRLGSGIARPAGLTLLGTFLILSMILFLIHLRLGIKMKKEAKAFDTTSEPAPSTDPSTPRS